MLPVMSLERMIDKHANEAMTVANATTKMLRGNQATVFAYTAPYKDGAIIWKLYNPQQQPCAEQNH
jgi:hypothetical protein